MKEDQIGEEEEQIVSGVSLLFYRWMRGDFVMQITYQCIGKPTGNS